MDKNHYTNRRQILFAVGALGIANLAGCSEDGESGGTVNEGVDADGGGGSDGNGETERPTETLTEATGGGDGGESTPTETPTPTETRTPTATPTPERSVDLVLGATDVFVLESQYSEDLVGEVAITNEGTIPTAGYTVGLDWLDENDEYIATTDVNGMLLEPDETWEARRFAWLDVDDTEKIESVEASVTEMNSPDRVNPNPEWIELDDQQVRASDDEVVVRGKVTNTKDTSEFIDIAAKVYNANGIVVGTEWTLEEVAGGDSWRFELNPNTYGRNGAVESGKVIPFVDVI